MTKEQIKAAFEMRVDGASFEEIAGYLGVSRQAVHDLMTRMVSSGNVYAKCVFPGIRRWMIEHDVSRRQMALALRPDEKPSWLYKKLEGRFRLHMDEIRAILKYTGMTFEEAFGEEEEHGCEQPGEGQEV